MCLLKNRINFHYKERKIISSGASNIFLGSLSYSLPPREKCPNKTYGLYCNTHLRVDLKLNSWYFKYTRIHVTKTIFVIVPVGHTFARNVIYVLS